MEITVSSEHPWFGSIPKPGIVAKYLTACEKISLLMFPFWFDLLHFGLGSFLHSILWQGVLHLKDSAEQLQKIIILTG